MLTIIHNILIKTGIGEKSAENVSYIVLAIIIFILCLISVCIARVITNSIIIRYIKNNKINWDDALIESGMIKRLFHIIPIAIVKAFVSDFGRYSFLADKAIDVYLTFFVLLIIDSALNAIDIIYSKREISKIRPIKGLLQVIKIASFIIGGVVIIADLLDKSPVVMLSGIGAMTAVFSLIFKDSILGLVAGIQLSANDMVRIGDWIEMPKYSADGDVIEISLNTVKVQNFDKTITTIPAYALISDSFKNWRGMENWGGRRIKRAVNIDVNSISFCSDDFLEKLKSNNLLKDYIETRQSEIDEYNKKMGLDPVGAINARPLTNIGVFREYITRYLKNHPGVSGEMIQMVRQLSPGENGLPIEIYVFANDTQWTKYENIQSDIFDHILSVVGLFGLRVYQNPTGRDFSTRTDANSDYFGGKNEK
ncbi:MAG: mechanosensitive ion channel [Oscillospiraceae bacterium]|nr:mechanosensitive ion channel [Oscillospiraceae bacterium]